MIEPDICSPPLLLGCVLVRRELPRRHARNILLTRGTNGGGEAQPEAQVLPARFGEAAERISQELGQAEVILLIVAAADAAAVGASVAAVALGGIALVRLGEVIDLVLIVARVHQGIDALVSSMSTSRSRGRPVIIIIATSAGRTRRLLLLLSATTSLLDAQLRQLFRTRPKDLELAMKVSVGIVLFLQIVGRPPCAAARSAVRARSRPRSRQAASSIAAAAGSLMSSSALSRESR